jgi:hypothetical protein
VTNGKLAAKAVGTGKLADGAVTASKLGAGAVGTAQLGRAAVTGVNIATGAVTAPDLGAGSVGSAALGTGSVGSAALGTGSVGTSALAANAVTSAKVADGSLTASDVAPGTFLATGGTAANSAQLDGLTAAGYVQGTGRLMTNRVTVAVGQTVPLLELNFAHINATCAAGVFPQQSLVAELPLENVIYTAQTNAGATDVSTANAVTAGNFLSAPHATTTPQTITWQAAFNDGTDHLATAWTTGQDEGGTCVFTGQAITTLN